MSTTSSPQENQEETMEQLRSLSKLMDNAITIPGTSYRIGIDPFLGLIPVVGDYAGAVISAYIVLQSVRLGVSKSTLTRMIVNIITEALVGSIPMLGDIFDAGWKANAKNVSMLETHVKSGQKRHEADRGFLILLLVGLLVAVLIATAISVIILRFFFNLLFG